MNDLVVGVFQSVRHRVHETTDLFVDGGLLCNYPIHAFDGKFVLLCNYPIHSFDGKFVLLCNYPIHALDGKLSYFATIQFMQLMVSLSYFAIIQFMHLMVSLEEFGSTLSYTGYSVCANYFHKLKYISFSNNCWQVE